MLQQRGGDNTTNLQSQLKALWGASLLHIDDLPFGQRCEDMPHVFTKFRLKVPIKLVLHNCLAPTSGPVQGLAFLRPLHVPLQARRKICTAESEKILVSGDR